MGGGECVGRSAHAPAAGDPQAPPGSRAASLGHAGPAAEAFESGDRGAGTAAPPSPSPATSRRWCGREYTRPGSATGPSPPPIRRTRPCPSRRRGRGDRPTPPRGRRGRGRARGGVRDARGTGPGAPRAPGRGPGAAARTWTEHGPRSRSRPLPRRKARLLAGRSSARGGEVQWGERTTMLQPWTTTATTFIRVHLARREAGESFGMHCIGSAGIPSSEEQASAALPPRPGSVPLRTPPCCEQTNVGGPRGRGTPPSFLRPGDASFISLPRAPARPRLAEVGRARRSRRASGRGGGAEWRRRFWRGRRRRRGSWWRGRRRSWGPASS